LQKPWSGIDCGLVSRGPSVRTNLALKLKSLAQRTISAMPIVAPPKRMPDLR
jgi:hypothetical protein